MKFLQFLRRTGFKVKEQSGLRKKTWGEGDTAG